MVRLGICMLDSVGTYSSLEAAVAALRHLAELLPIGVYIVDARGAIMHCNDRMAAIWGRKPEPGAERYCASARNYWIDGSVMQPEDSPVACVLKDANPRLGIEVLIERPDGRRRHCIANAHPLKDDAGRLIGAINSLVDVTEQKQTEESLRDQRERLRALFEQATAGIAQVDLSGRFLFVNRQFCRIVGYSVEELLLMRMQDITHPDDVEPNLKLFARAADRGEPYVMEKRYIRKDGAQVWISLSANIMRDAAGKADSILGIIIDITERKHAEERLSDAKREAELANTAKDRFLAVLSHELRTPLTPVAMAIATLEGRRDLPETVQHDIAMIRRNIDLETRLIDDLLDITRISHGKIRLAPRPTAVHDVIVNVLEICRNDAQAKRLELCSELNAVGDRVMGDPARLQQVLWNLVKNSIKFTPENGRVTIRTSSPSDSHIQIEVCDTGIGIEPPALARIFNAFEQGEQTVTRQFGGLGLGLAISKALVELHGGMIAAHSDGRGKGSRFVLNLPIVPAQTAIEPAAPAPLRCEPAPSATPLHVLLVDDHADTLVMLRRLLEGSGFDVTTASSVAAALAAAGQKRIDLLISDVGLPDATGYELMRQIKARYGIPGIAVSGFGMDSDVRTSRDAGFDAHMTKPVNFDELAATIHRTVHGQVPSQANT